MRFVLAGLFAFGGLSFSQALTSLSGTVADPTGALVPGASVRIVNAATGQSREVRSDSQGRYAFPQILPGTYSVSAKAPGFAELTVPRVEALVNTPVTLALEFQKLGAQAESVTVDASAAQVNTTDASLGNAIGSQAILELPFYARNVAGLLQYQPGVTSFGTDAGDDDRNGSVNGGKSDQANVTLDGVDVNDQAYRTAFTSVLRVTLDSVQEFRTTTSNGGADTGRGSGAEVALVTKSGTNEFHGSLYEYHRNTITAANDFFNNRTGVARPALLINIFGFSAGGPIRKNRAFFFINYEGRRDASAQITERAVPSDLLRQGIVQFTNRAGKLASVDPDTIRTTVDPLHIGVNPASLKIFNLYPRANDFAYADGLNFVGYRFNAPVHGDENTYIARFDYAADSAGKHQLFWRGNLQNDASNTAPQFPGQQPNSVHLNNSKGFAAGWTAALNPTLVSTFRYGLTRYGDENTGIQNFVYTHFRGLDDLYGTTAGYRQIIPVHNLTQDFAWNHKAHDVRVGGTLRFIRNGTRDFSHSYNYAVTNASWLRGTGSDITPRSLGVAPTDALTYADAMIALLGVVSQGYGQYNYLTDGTQLPAGAPVSRQFNSEEYEMYIQDSWRLRPNLTLTAGLRYSLMPPVYEANGQQISSNLPLGAWLNQRGALAAQGLPQSQAGLITYILANGPGGRPLYPYHKNPAPRLGLAYSPKGDSGLSKALFGAGKTSIRAGFGMYYDLVGQPLAATNDASAFGLQTTLVNPSGTLTSSSAPRFTDFFAVPAAVVRPALKGGFPVQQPVSGEGSFAITNTIDDALKAPYSMNLSFSIGREFSHGVFIQGSYVGRLSRHSLINRDLAMPTDLRDPKSGQTYFQAASQLMKLMLAGVQVNDLPKIPFFENMWATAGTPKFSPTQVWALDARDYESPQDFVSVLADMDHYCDPAGTTPKGELGLATPGCGIYGPNMMFSPQFSALSAMSSIGTGSYHAMQWTVRKRFTDSLLFDLNYTFSKSIDLASRAESAGSFAGFLYNTWNPSQRKAVSDYDVTHAVNAYGVWQIPVGRGKRFGSQVSRLMDAFIGGWQLSGTYRQTSGLPTGPGNGRRWPTNWELSGFATPNGTPQPAVTNDKNAPSVSGSAADAGPNLWSNPAAALAAWGFTLAGQSGSRNTIRGAGFFDVDGGLSKKFRMPYRESQTLQFRWEAFNVTNTARLDPASANLSLTSVANWGALISQLGSPRQMQFALRYQF